MAKAKKDPNAPETPATPPGDDPLSLHYGSSQPGIGIILTPSQKAALGPTPESTTVTMDVLSDRSYGGQFYKVGDTVEVAEEHVEALTGSGFAARADRVERAQAAREAATARAEALANLTAGSTAVKPMATTDVPGAEPPKE